MSQTKAQLISDLVQALNFTGTASAPANGLFLSASNQLKLATASTERLKIDGTEVVVNDTGSDVDFRVESDTNPNFFKIDAGSEQASFGGTVTASGYTLEVLRSTADPFVNATDTVLRLNNTNTSADTNQTSLLFTTATSGVGSDSAIVSQSTSAGNSRLEFWTDTSNVLSKKMTLDAAGRLLIGTTTEGHPSADNLTIRDTGNAGITIRSGDTSNGAIFFSDATSGDAEFDGYVQYNHGAAPFMQFGVADDTVMALKGINVGIGTTSPSASLHINTGANGLPKIRLEHTGAGNDVFEITSGLSGISNSGFGIYDVGETAYRLAIDTSGNVGIGTTSPGHLLEVKSSAQNANDVITQIESVAVGSGLSKTSLELHKGSGYGAQLSGYIDQGVGSGFILSTLNGGNASERMRIDSDGTIFSFSPNDTTPNIKWRSDDTNWFGSLNQSVEGSTISTFLAVAGDWSANGSTYSATKNFNGSFETRAIALHPQFNGGAGKVSFLVKAGGSSTTDGAVSEILKIDNDGIKFGGDTAAANALDDYEEGTWTPSFNNAGGLSTNNTVGKYTKIGRVVNWVCQIAVVRDSTSSSGTFTLGGLPFTSLNGATGGHGYAGCMGALFNWNVPDTAYQIGIRVPDNTTIIQFFANFDNTADAQLTSPFDANRTIFGSLSGQYIT